LIVIMLEPMPRGEDFETWPMHITVVPWFPCDKGRKLDKILMDLAARHQPMEVRVGGPEDWGRADKFKVIKIEEDGQLHALHMDVFSSLEKNDYPIHQKDYLGEKYVPHITLRNSLADDKRYETGEVIQIDRFTLVSQQRLKGSGRTIKTLVRDYELGA
jgi:2'-5' RNA ligase